MFISKSADSISIGIIVPHCVHIEFRGDISNTVEYYVIIKQLFIIKKEINMNQLFTENEKVAVALVMTQMLVADKKIAEQELINKYELSIKYGIPLSVPGNSGLNFEKSKEIINNMDKEKKSIVVNILHKIAESDSDFAEQEKQLLEEFS